jgi:sterol 3beta-glucosyltransferase
VGFGSMRELDSERLTREVLHALEIAGQRGVIFTGGGGALTRLPAPPTVFYVDNAPHTWLFPRMAALVHHGGAGTTGSALRAGVPSIIAPLVIDQHAWAWRIEKLGVGLRVGPLRKLTARKLAPALRTALNDAALRARAAALSEKVRAERNAVAYAVEVIENYARDFAEHRKARSH